MKKILFISIFLFNFVNINAQWNLIHNNQYYSYGCIYFINASTGWVSSGLSIWKSTNGGINFSIQISYPINVYPHWMHFVNENYGWAVCQDGHVISTTNSGVNWVLKSIGDSSNLHCVYFINTLTGWIVGSEPNYMSYDSGNRIYKTTNGGMNWFSQYNNISSGFNSVFFVNSLTGWVVGGPDRIMKTTNGGQNWNQQSIEYFGIMSIFFISPNTGWVAGLDGKFYSTTNGGTNWLAKNISGFDNSIFSIWFTNSETGWVVGYWANIFKTTNGGNNWISQYNGTYLDCLRCVMFVSNNIGWACGDDKIFKTTNGGGVIGIKNISTNKIPDNFSLCQNYPNPFNPSTTISYKVISYKVIRLVVYNILGKEVAVLVNEKLKPGEYETQFPNNSITNNQLPSGIYFYSLFADGERVDTKKMVLIK
jgi:photosystem II stability/assembly factor-like uncharacterized protein